MAKRQSDKDGVRQGFLDFARDPLQLMSVDEIFAQADDHLLGQLKEDKRIERKSASFAGERLGDYFSMWANTAPDGGLIAIGHSDKGGFEGCKGLTSEAINQREKTGFTFCPDARFEVKNVPVSNRDGESDFILLFRVQYNRETVVRTTKQKAFVRRGDSCIELRPEEIKELQNDKGTISFELQDCSLNWPKDFDDTAIAAFIGAVRTQRKLPLDLTTEQVMDLRRMGSILSGKFRPNIACALLFANDPIRVIHGCKVRFQRFEGESERTGTEYNAVKDLILEGTVPQLIQQVETILESQLRTFAPLDASVKFFPVSEYPKNAWYEAIVNACVHRSYGNGLKNMPIFVKMFDDKLVIESPGPFPPLVTPVNIYESHIPRNPCLMEAMFYMKYVRCAHEGTKRIRNDMEAMKLPAPEFKQDPLGPPIVRVTLRNDVKQRRAWVDRDVSKIVTGAFAADLTADEIRALNAAAENGSITVSDANKLLDISWDRAKKLLFELAKKRVFQYIRFKPFLKDKRDPKAFFRLRSADALPKGAYEVPFALLEPVHEIAPEAPVVDDNREFEAKPPKEVAPKLE